MGDYDPIAWKNDFETLINRLPDPGAQQRARQAMERILKGTVNPEATGLPVMTADDILTAQFPEPTWVVPGILPAGLALLAGRPKVGKSWLALQLCQAVAAGGFALGQHVPQGATLYLALEDSAQRLQGRMNKQHWPPGLPADFVCLGGLAHGALRNGGGERLAEQIEQRGYRLAVIDTLTRAIGGDPNDHEAMAEALAPLQEIAHARGCCVMIVDHHRKLFTAEPDAISDVLGTTGKGAIADTILGLYRERGKPGARLQITGRDVEERTLDLFFDQTLGIWQAEESGPVVTDKQRDLLDILRLLEGAAITEVAEAMGRSKGAAYSALVSLEQKGLACRKHDKRWYAVDDD